GSKWRIPIPTCFAWEHQPLRLSTVRHPTNELDGRSCDPTGLLAVRFSCMVQTRVGTDACTRSQNSDYCRCRGVMRDHFDDAPSAGVVCYRLYGFLRFPGDQA